MKIMKKVKSFLLFCFAISLVVALKPLTVMAEPTSEGSYINVDSFVINSSEGSKYNATIKTSAQTATNFNYTIAVVTDISQDGKVVASGSGTTGVDVVTDIDMSKINTYKEYRFKITLTYDHEGKEYFKYAFSKVFEYTQETYAEDFSGRDITVNASEKTVNINWSRYKSWSCEAAVIVVNVDGEEKESLVERDKTEYTYYYDEKAKEINIKLYQVIDGQLSNGIEDTISLNNSKKDDFYLEFPKDEQQYNSVWTIKYFNGDNTELKWETESERGEEKLDKDGAFIVTMGEDDKSLFLEYTDKNQVKWQYNFSLDIVTYAPVITLLEEYDKCVISEGSIVIAGKVDTAAAEVTVNGKKAKIDKRGGFRAAVDLETGKNIITIKAENSYGKSAQTSITVYRKGNDGILKDVSFFGKYSPLIISLSVSVVVIIIIVIVVKKKGGEKNEKRKKTDK